ncbi:MAG: multicopper oxidase family protein [Candidatus Woesearchaeota archaeon]|nr:multicopper oxidase family protein [Candidatus Woesearchaeota archaeon]
MRYIIALTLLLVACSPTAPTVQGVHNMDDMPCHQMPDGTWMGRCDEAPEIFTIAEREDLAKAASSRILYVKNGDEIDLTSEIVEKEINGQTIRMYGYNGMIPGPVLRAKQGATITVNFRNNIDQETTVHWHGLRHDVKDDGVPGVSQDPVLPGGKHVYTVSFPDDGVFWYHPHVREDIQQDAGLAGNMIVLPNNYDAKVNREEVLMLDDILLEGEQLEYGKDHADHAIMGRFGNTMLVNGEEEFAMDANEGDVVRFYITNVANARPFKLVVPGASMKRIASDLSFYEREELIDELIIGPAERYIVDVHFPTAKTYTIQHRAAGKIYNLVTVLVKDTPARNNFASVFFEERKNEEIIEEISDVQHHFSKEPDYDFELDIKMPDMHHEMHEAGPIEWEDTMQELNKAHTTKDVTWVIRDTATGKENMDIMIDTKLGDIIKMRFTNKENSMHPMQHPIHLHGQRFLVIEKDGERNENMVWKDTTLIPAGSTYDLLVDITNPGMWMMHCHIAEHLDAGMMAMMNVEVRE